MRSFYGKPQHASAGNETGYSGFNSRHIDWTIRTPESSRSSSTISSLYDGFGQRISISEIGGQDEVIDTTNDKERIQTTEEESSSPMETDQHNVTNIKEPSAAKERQQMDQSPQPRAAAPIAPCPMGTPAATVSSPSPPSMGPCLFSPSAPQVEDYALDAVPIPSILVQETLMMDKQDGTVPPYHIMCDHARGASPVLNDSLFQAPSKSPIRRRSTSDKPTQASLSRNRLEHPRQ